MSQATHGTSKEAPLRKAQVPHGFHGPRRGPVLVWIAFVFVPAGT
jgi:hypothetical protein